MAKPSRSISWTVLSWRSKLNAESGRLRARSRRSLSHLIIRMRGSIASRTGPSALAGLPSLRLIVFSVPRKLIHPSTSRRGSTAAVRRSSRISNRCSPYFGRKGGDASEGNARYVRVTQWGALVHHPQLSAKHVVKSDPFSPASERGRHDDVQQPRRHPRQLRCGPQQHAERTESLPCVR